MFKKLSFEEAMKSLNSSMKLGISPMLETVIDMLDFLDRPDKSFEIIQIAGTNGKTSTSRYVASILKGEGYKVGLYTSPELVDYKERIEIDSSIITEDLFAEALSASIYAGQKVNKNRVKSGLTEYSITEFDITTVAALYAFDKANIDIAVLEVGMGGRWDATSATYPKTVSITGIGLDHTKILGSTLEKIAGEKAAIIKEGQNVILGEGCFKDKKVKNVMLNKCIEHNVTPVICGNKIEGASTSYKIISKQKSIFDTLIFDILTKYGIYSGLKIIKPQYQLQNIACALTICEEHLGHSLNIEQLKSSVLNCPTPGRFEVLSKDPLHLIDASHNPQSIFNFLNSLNSVIKDEKPALLCAIFADKDCKKMVEILSNEFDEIYVTQTQNKRALNAGELYELFENEGVTPVQKFETVDAACASLSDKSYVCAGTITLAGEVKRYHERQNF